MVKNTGKENMEIITKEGEKINKYTPSEDQSGKSGKKGKKGGYRLRIGEWRNHLCARRLRKMIIFETDKNEKLR